MITTTQPVPLYHRGESLFERIFDALERNGKASGQLTREDLGGIDEVHPGGREATRDLGRLAGLSGGMAVLDVGCGLGGPARTLAAEFGCRVTGVDSDPDRLAAAGALSEAMGLAGEVEFGRADATDLPFPGGSFDAVWVQHVAANVADKAAMFTEARRVLRPRGRLALYEPCAGPSGPAQLPVPWADAESECCVVPPEELRRSVEAAGFECFAWEDRTGAALRYVQEAMGGAVFVLPSNPPPLGLNLVVDRAAERQSNLARNLEAGRLRVIQGVFLAR